MKLNWGFGIATFYASFMVILLYFVFKSTTHDNSLVMDNYYEQDLKYQAHYDKVVNTMQLKEQPSFQQNDSAQTLDIQFPQGMSNPEGAVQFFRPSSKYQDITVPLKVNEDGKMTIPTKLLKAGRWKIKMDWESDQKAYYLEKAIEL
jgi:nitrogen fixation protein FixH